jgi:hypothetical protein
MTKTPRVAGAHHTPVVPQQLTAAPDSAHRENGAVETGVVAVAAVAAAAGLDEVT